MKELFGTVERHNTAPPRVDQESGGAQFHSAALFPFYPALPSFHCTEFTADSAYGFGRFVVRDSLAVIYSIHPQFHVQKHLKIHAGILPRYGP